MDDAKLNFLIQDHMQWKSQVKKESICYFIW